MSVKDGEVLNAVIQSLGQIVEASFVTQRQKDHIAALLQSRADAQEDAEFGSGTMDEGGVNAILDTLADMEEKAEASLTEVRKGEADAQMSHAMLKQGLENEIENMKQEKGESTSKSASTAAALAQAEKDLATEKKSLAEDETYLRDLKRDCQSRATDFEVEARDNQAELKALEAAKAILLKKFAAFVQTSAKARARVTVRDDDNDDAKQRALKSIEQLGKRLHSTALVALAYRAAADPFVKIRGMIEDMIAKLLEEAAAEATQKAFCDKEIGESKKVKGDKEGKLDKVNARLEKSQSATATLTEDVSKLSAEVAENDKAIRTRRKSGSRRSRPSWWSRRTSPRARRHALPLWKCFGSTTKVHRSSSSARRPAPARKSMPRATAAAFSGCSRSPRVTLPRACRRRAPSSSKPSRSTTS